MTLAPRLLRTEDAATYCGVSASLWAELVKLGAVPKPIELSKRVKVWDRAALDRWIDTLGQPASGGFDRVQ